MSMIGPAELLRRRVADDPSRPLVTFYDDATGERVELSARTFDNWVSKTANLLVDGLAAEPGTRVVLALPPHWQSAAWLMACWAAGLEAVPVGTDLGTDPGTGDDPGWIGSGTEPPGTPGPYILVAAEEVLDAVTADRDAEEIVGLSLHALGGALAECPAGVVDYAVEVRSYGDRFTPPPDATPDAPALSVTKTTLSGARLVAEAIGAAEKWDFDARDRVLVDMPYTTLEGVLVGLLSPLASGASVIIQRNFDKASLDRRATLEHVTAVAGVPGWNDASGSVRRLL
ncbi:TIGR03089 family protein [Actinomadura sp. 21ATH]|uniref:TIGR03089 family protein n=1 Tax=Actinomadura sp. 21ATH TaxID=1735444 RepID=UPI0035BF579D